MKRRLLNVAAGISLLLCVAVCAVWARSFRVADGLEWGRGRAWGYVQTSNGFVLVGLGRREANVPEYHYGPRYFHEAPNRPLYEEMFRSSEGGDKDASWRWGDFWHRVPRNAGSRLYGQWVAPLWFAALTSALLPLGWTMLWRRTRRRERRKRTGLCPACGYDLRASPQRCPECGLAAGAA